MEWLASAAFGLEGLVKRDLQRLNAHNIRPQDTGGVLFEGDMGMGFSANLWLRTADRVLLVLGRFPARTFEELFQGVRALRWEDYLPRDARFPVKAHCAKSQLMSPSDCQSIAKKAVVERLRAAYGGDWFSESGVEYEIDISIRADVVLVALNSSGESLSRRGYRTWNGEAPLRETLAAAVLLASPWRPALRLYDPLCGTGTLMIEAAFIALDRAPGLTRQFAMENWAFVSQEDMQKLRREARMRFEAGYERKLDIAGSDIDPDALELAQRHIQQAGLNGRIALKKLDIRDVPPDAGDGAIVTNPPYGERLGDIRAAQAVARQLGLLAARRPDWSVSAITGDRGFEKAYGRRASSRRRFYNGRIECELVVFQAKDKNGGIKR